MYTQMTALAAALGVNIYVINLSDKLLTDEILVDLLTGTPLRTLPHIHSSFASSGAVPAAH